MKANSDQEPGVGHELLDTIRELHRRGWCLATGGNFSRRMTSGTLWITASGLDKGELTEQSFLRADLAGRALDPDVVPSAETLLHARLYALDAKIGAVLHTHSVASTVLSRIEASPWLKLTGYEMQKALAGNTTHRDTVRIRVFDNDQDIGALADAVERAWPHEIDQPGLLVRGHGLYAWGEDVAAARRHVEGLEFLFACEVTARRLGGYAQ